MCYCKLTSNLEEVGIVIKGVHTERSDVDPNLILYNIPVVIGALGLIRQGMETRIFQERYTLV